MYEWLRAELDRVRWPGFHVVTSCRETLDNKLPPSYLAFVRQFGSAKLYRQSHHYQVGVLCPPETAELPEGAALCIGYWLSTDAYFKTSELAEGREVSVYEMQDGDLEDVAPDFATWLEACANEANEEYTKEERVRLEGGPDGFTAEEQAIVDARRKFSWQFLGAGEGNKLRLLVRNNSDRVLKALTLGIKAKGGVVEGVLPVDTREITPGSERIVEVDGYATLPSADAVVFDLPEPTPAERNRYSELATSGPMKR